MRSLAGGEVDELPGKDFIYSWQVTWQQRKWQAAQKFRPALP